MSGSEGKRPATRSSAAAKKGSDTSSEFVFESISVVGQLPCLDTKKFFDTAVDSEADLFQEIFEHSFLIASLVDGVGIPAFPPPLPSRVEPENSPFWNKVLRIIARNLRIARLRLSTADVADLDKRLDPVESATRKFPAFPLSAEVEKATRNSVPSKELSKAKAAGQPASSSSASYSCERKVQLLTDATRKIRAALRQRKVIAEQLSLAQASAAEFQAKRQNAPHSLRDYRASANAHLTAAEKNIFAVIEKSAELEDLDPVVPHRSSPVPPIPVSLGELPEFETSTRAVQLQDFASEDFSLPGSSAAAPKSKRRK